VSMVFTHRRVAAVLAVAVALATVTGGCGLIGDDKKSDTTTTPLGTLPPTAAESATTSTTVPQEYVVQAGDTLTKIAQMFGTTVADLVSLNQIQDPDRIAEGQRIKVPPTTTTTAAGGAGPPPGATTTTAAPPPSSSG
jgi:LysM repeat protein